MQPSPGAGPGHRAAEQPIPALGDDSIIVGAGTAGCLLANRLSADPKQQVLLIEAGRRDDYPWIHIPVGYLYCIGNPRTGWLYRTEPDAGLNGRSLRYPRGKTLGGSSSINGMIYMRGQARDYDHLAALTHEPAWGWAECLPDFIAHENHDRLDALAQSGRQAESSEALASWLRHHGHPAHPGAGRSTGEWRVERQRLRWDILDAFRLAAQQAGIPATEDSHTGDNEGVAYFEVNQQRGWRWNASKAFLRPVQGRPNLSLWTGAQVCRLRVQVQEQGMACTGVELLRQGERMLVQARREVILCAGAIGSPQLLMLSGIGRAAELHALGIQPIIDLPGVGGNLQDHLQIRAVYKVQGVRMLNTLAHSLWGKARIALEYALFRSGPMSMAPSQLGAFTRSDPERPHPNLEYHVQPLSLDAFGEPLHRFDAFTASVCNLNPTSRGRASLKSPRFEDAQAIAPNYLSTHEDRRVAAASLRLTRRIVAQPALAAYRPEEYRPGVQFQSEEELNKLAGDIATTIFHPVGTAKMGNDADPEAVVDPHLRLRDGRGGRVAGLRVVDASIMPTITSGNTNSPVLMIAEKAARWIRAGQ